MNIDELIAHLTKLNDDTRRDILNFEDTLNKIDIVRAALKQQIEQNEKRKNLEKEKTELLQRDQNLSSDIACMKKQIADLTEKINALELERENIHKRWIEINPLKKSNDATQPIDTSIDNIINVLKNINYPGVMSQSKKETKLQYLSIMDLFKDVFEIREDEELNDNDIKEYKKFYNLIKRRCVSSRIYGTVYTRDTLIGYMNDAQREYARILGS